MLKLFDLPLLFHRNYGLLGWCDALHGTDKKYWALKKRQAEEKKQKQEEEEKKKREEEEKRQKQLESEKRTISFNTMTPEDIKERNEKEKKRKQAQDRKGEKAIQLEISVPKNGKGTGTSMSEKDTISAGLPIKELEKIGNNMTGEDRLKEIKKLIIKQFEEKGVEIKGDISLGKELESQLRAEGANITDILQKAGKIPVTLGKDTTINPHEYYNGDHIKKDIKELSGESYDNMFKNLLRKNGKLEDFDEYKNDVDFKKAIKRHFDQDGNTYDHPQSMKKLTETLGN